MILVNHKAMDGDDVFAQKLKGELSMDSCTGPNTSGACWFEPASGNTCASYVMSDWFGGETVVGFDATGFSGWCIFDGGWTMNPGWEADNVI